MSLETERTLISSDIIFLGEVNSKDDLVIEGKLEGIIKSNADVKVNIGGYLKGDISAQQVFISGKLQGNIQKADFLYLDSHGELIGDVNCKDINIEKGGKYRGTVITKNFQSN